MTKCRYCDQPADTYIILAPEGKPQPFCFSCRKLLILLNKREGITGIALHDRMEEGWNLKS